MQKDTHKTVVVFRVFKDTGAVLALFPHEPGTNEPGTCSSYMRIGQHSSADYAHCIAATRPAKPEEYESLRKELENNIGYNLAIRKRARVKFWTRDGAGMLVERT